MKVQANQLHLTLAIAEDTLIVKACAAVRNCLPLREIIELDNLPVDVRAYLNIHGDTMGQP